MSANATSWTRLLELLRWLREHEIVISAIAVQELARSKVFLLFLVGSALPGGLPSFAACHLFWAVPYSILLLFRFAFCCAPPPPPAL